MDEPALAQHVARHVREIVIQIVGEVLQQAPDELAAAAFYCSCGAVVASYSCEAREKSLLEQLSDRGWPRGERRVAVQLIADLAVANSSDRSMLRRALGFVDPALGSLSLEAIDDALSKQSSGARLIYAAGALGVRIGSSLKDELDRMRHAIKACQERGVMDSGELRLRLFLMEQMSSHLIHEPLAANANPDADRLERIGLAATVVASAVLAALKGNRQRLESLGAESMPMVERRAVFVEFLKKAKGPEYEAVIYSCVDSLLSKADVTASTDTDPIRRGARAALQVGALGFDRFDRIEGEPLPVAIQRANDELRRARVPKSRAKRQPRNR